MIARLLYILYRTKRKYSLLLKNFTMFESRLYYVIIWKSFNKYFLRIKRKKTFQIQKSYATFFLTLFLTTQKVRNSKSNLPIPTYAKAAMFSHWSRLSSNPYFIVFAFREIQYLCSSKAFIQLCLRISETQASL